jgi:hypothetical protein
MWVSCLRKIALAMGKRRKLMRSVPARVSRSGKHRASLALGGLRHGSLAARAIGSAMIACELTAHRGTTGASYRRMPERSLANAHDFIQSAIARRVAAPGSTM